MKKKDVVIDFSSDGRPRVSGSTVAQVLDITLDELDDWYRTAVTDRVANSVGEPGCEVDWCRGQFEGRKAIYYTVDQVAVLANQIPKRITAGVRRDKATESLDDLCRGMTSPQTQVMSTLISAFLRCVAQPETINTSVYFVYVFRTKRIKIGVSHDPVVRSKQISRAIKSKVELLGVMPGDRSTEAATHKRFSTHLVKGEWFKDVPEIREFIKENCVQKPAVDRLTFGR